MWTQGHDLYLKQSQWVRNWRTGQPITSDFPTRIDEPLLTLQSYNLKLWDAEDQSRKPDLSDAELGCLKRQIDFYNLNRVKTINTIDGCLIQDLITTDFAQPEAKPEMNTETPGQILDRLSILALKIYHGEAISSDSGQAAVLRMKAEVDFLCWRLTQLMEALENGQLLFYPSFRFKIYQGEHYLSQGT